MATKGHVGISNEAERQKCRWVRKKENDSAQTDEILVCTLTPYTHIPILFSSLAAKTTGPHYHPITKTYLHNFDPIKPYFYKVKLGFTGVYIIFLISAQKHRLRVLIRTTLVRQFYQVPTIYVFLTEIWKISEFLSENFQFLVVKFSLYLNRHANPT